MKNDETTTERFQEVDSFLQKGLNLEADIMGASLHVRELSKLAYKQEWLDARLQLAAIVRHLQEFKAGIPGKTCLAISERLTLVMVFAQGATVTETLISEGQYIKATAALKQDYEVLTRIIEVKGGIAKSGKVPNVRHAPKGSQRFYGDLNDVAHPSNLHLLQNLLREIHEGEVHGVSSVPAFNKTVACSLYELHVWLFLEIAREYILLSIEMYGDQERGIAYAAKWFVGVIELLLTVGFEVSASSVPE